MQTTVQFRRGTTAQNNAFTGANGEISVDTDDGRLVLHDGSTAGGTRQALASETIFRVVADDSTGIYLQGGTDELRISGGTGVTTSTDSGGSVTISLDSDITTVNTISSADSTAVTIADNANIEGTLQVNSTINAVGNITTAGSFIIGSASINETDLEKIDGITNGAGAANKALVLDGSANVASGLAALTASGVVTAGGFTIGSAVINEADLEQIDDLTAGTVTASKAVVVDSDKDIGDFRNVTLSGTLHTTTLDVREIESTDSTVVTVNEGLEILGTLQVNEIVASDSSEVTINNIRTQVITANDSTEILVNDAMRVSGLITGTATQAQYADLAEIFPTDDTDLEPGDVVDFSGDNKVTKSNQEAHTSVAGVVSTEPGFLLNEGGTGVKLAMTGKVPCKVQGIVNAGDLLVSAGNGNAKSATNPSVGTVIGKAIENHTSDGNGVINIMVVLM